MDSDLLDLPTHLPNASTDAIEANNPPESKEDPVNQESQSNPHETNHTQPSKDTDVDSDEDEELHSTKPQSNSIFIPGTTIKLETDEDIQKWIAERKRNWPTKKNLEMKQLESQQVNDNNDKKRKAQDDNKSTDNAKKPRNICRFYKQHQSCKFGNKCKNSHELDSDYKLINNIKVKVPKNFENKYYNPNNPSENSSLYKMLVKKDQLELENNQFIDFLYYLENQGLIKHEFNNDN